MCCLSFEDAAWVAGCRLRRLHRRVVARVAKGERGLKMKVLGMGLPELVLVLPMLLFGLVVPLLFLWACVCVIRWFYRQDRASKAPERAEARRSLGQILKSHREQCHMTQELVAQSVGVSRQAVSKWESGAAEPNTTNLIALAELFGTTAPDLLREVTG